MRAICYYTTGSVDVVVDVDLPKPTPGLRDVLVEVRAISVNPVDAKIRSRNGPGGPGGDVKVLGWDAAGIVATVGTEATRFTPSDEAYYAGSLDRAGCYAEFQVVDERVVGRKPARLAVRSDSFASKPNEKVTAPIWRRDTSRQYGPQPCGPIPRGGEHAATVGAEGRI